MRALRPLTRKLLRDARRHWIQVLSIAAVMGCAVMTIAGLQSTIRSLELARDSYFARHRLADVFATLQRAPLGVRERIARVPGISAVDLRVVKSVKLDVPGLTEPATARVVSIPTARAPMVNEPSVRRGRWIAPGREDEVLVSEQFADANHLVPGDTLGAVMNGRWRRLHIVGIALSPEYVIEGVEGSFGDSRRFGILWASRDLVDAAFDMDGAFNDVVALLTPGANRASVLAALDRELAPYGSAGAVPRAEHPHVVVLSREMEQLRVNAVVFSAFFLVVSAFLLNVVLSRLVAAQREEVAALKAFGYTNAEVGRHYLAFALIAIGAGASLGLPGALWMTGAFVDMYRPFFHFPRLVATLSWPSFVGASAVSGAFALLGALGAVLRAARLPPAQALRPESPTVRRRLLIERMGLGRFASPATRLVFRNLERRPLRTFSSMVGIGLAIAILVAGRFPYDVFALVTHVQFEVAARDDFTVQFTNPAPARAARELEAIDGVRWVEPFRATPVRFATRRASRWTSLSGLPLGGQLHRVVDLHAVPHTLPPNSLVLPKGLAAELGLRLQDTVAVELLEIGVTRPAIVGGIIDEMVSMGPYMDLDALHGLLREGNVVSGAFVATDPGKTAAVAAAFKAYPGIAGASGRAESLRTFRDQTSQSTLLVMGLVIFSATVIAMGVVYNNARIALSERGREIGSLRVLGYTTQELTRMLVSEQALVTLASIPLGLVFGRLFSMALATGFESTHFHFPFSLRASSQAFAVGVVLLTTALGSAVVWRLVTTLDLMSVLKTRE